jgi:hypothetical protein
MDIDEDFEIIDFELNYIETFIPKNNYINELELELNKDKLELNKDNKNNLELNKYNKNNLELNELENRLNELSELELSELENRIEINIKLDDIRTFL